MTVTTSYSRISTLVMALAVMVLCTACSTSQASQLGWEAGASNATTNQVAAMGPSAGIF